MAFDGYFMLGGTEVLNQARTYTYVEQSDCPPGWIKCMPCPGLEDALGVDSYQGTLPDAPWYDAEDEATHRFYGLYPVEIDGLEGSTRTATITEGILDGGVVQGTRRAVRQVRVRGVMIGEGHDALDAGLGWLDKVLDGDTCGTHTGGSCGEVDSCFFITCPPERPDVDSYTPFTIQDINLATNPSFEATSGAIAYARQNVTTNPTCGAASTGWTNNPGTGGASSGARVTGLLASGFPVDTGFRVTWSTASTAVNGGLYVAQGLTPVTAGVTYSASIFFSPSIAQRIRVGIEWRDAGGALVSSSFATDVVAVAGGVYRQGLTAVAPALATGAIVSVYAFAGTGGVVWPVGATLTATALLVESSPIIGSYFDGTYQPRYRENLMSRPQATAAWAGLFGTGGAGVASETADTRFPGGVAKQIAWTTPPTNNNALYIGPNVNVRVTPGDTYTVSCYAAVENWADFGNYAYIYMAGVTQVSAGVVDMGGGLFRVHRTFTVDAATTQIAPVVAVSGGVSMPTITTTFRAGGMLVERVGTVGNYFDGATAAAPGFTFVWAAGVNASTSVQYDADLINIWTGTPNASASRVNPFVNAAGIAGASGIASSTRWSKTRTRSLRVMPRPGTNGLSSDSYAQMNLLPLLTPGRTYTILATLHQEGPLTGSTTPNQQRNLAIDITGGGGITRLLAWSNPQENAAGDHPHVLTFTLPDVPGDPITTLNLRLYNGYQIGAGDVWWDNLAIVEGVYAGPYFDGTTPGSEFVNYGWVGTPDASQSVHETRTSIEVPIDDEAYDALIDPLRRRMHGVTAISGPIVLNHFHRGHWHAYEVEFTLAVATPYVFGVQRELEVSYSTPTVVQDQPYNLVPYPSAELADAANLVVATNYSTNPSVETNATGWATNASVITPQPTGARSTELAAVGGASYKASVTATNSGVNAEINAYQIVDVSTLPAGSRFSVNMWGAGVITGGTAVLGSIVIRVDWQNAAGTFLRSDAVGTVAGSGGAASVKSLLPPAGAAKAQVVATLQVTSWSTGAVIALFADALAVTVP